MPINIVDWPADPECLGNQWFVRDIDELAHLTALVLIGRAQHVARILAGSQSTAAAPPPVALTANLREILFPQGPDPWHRDGLLFEVICWLTIRMSAGADDVVSVPHLRSTQQGLDSLKVSFDRGARTISKATIYEYKCTENARTKFRDEVLPAFAVYMSGARDNEIVQTAIELLLQMGLSDDEQVQAYDRMVQSRPLAFQASLTVVPDRYEKQKCVALFKGFNSLLVALEDRIGDTFPLEDIREWFASFAELVWTKIELLNV